MNASVIFPLLFLGIGACVTPSEKKQMKDDIFNLQTRLLELEGNFKTETKEVKTTGDAAAKRIASTQTTIDKINMEIQGVKGDIDALRIGVLTGQMPGIDPEKEGSVAATLAHIDNRLQEIEDNQKSILTSIKKAGVRRSKKARKPISSLKSLQLAFDKKRYLHVTQDAVAVIKKSKGKNRHQAQFLLAESYYKLGKLRDAALKFNDFIEAKPKGPMMPKALMRMGDCFRHLGDPETATLYYEELVKDFPSSSEAGKAKERIADFAKNNKRNKG